EAMLCDPAAALVRFGNFAHCQTDGGLCFTWPIYLGKRMAEVAFRRDSFSLLVEVIAVVTTPATGEVLMADIVGIGVPKDSHVGKLCLLKDPLHLLHGLFDIVLALRIHLWILALIKVMQRSGDGHRAFVSGFIALL